MRQEKQLLLDEVKEKIDESKGFIISSYQNLNADKARRFRDAVAEAEGEFEVVRKRVFIKALESAGLKFDDVELKGHIGVVFTKDDAIKLSKAAVKFGEAHEGTFTPLAGLIDGEMCTGEDVEAYAKLPSQNELRAQLLSVFEAPLSQTLAVFQAIMTSILYCLDEKAKKEE